MSTTDGHVISKTAHYALRSVNDNGALVLDWNPVRGLSAQDFRAGIADFARHCVARKAGRAVIDARQLDQGSPAIAWLRGQGDGEGEDYNSWWVREIVPLYNAAGITSLAVATGDPNAPGELADVPPAVNFRVAYLDDLDSALGWESA